MGTDRRDGFWPRRYRPIAQRRPRSQRWFHGQGRARHQEGEKEKETRTNRDGSTGWLLAAALSACNPAQTSFAIVSDGRSWSAVEQKAAGPAQPEPAGPVDEVPTPQMPGQEEPRQPAPAKGPSGDCGNQTCTPPEQCIEYLGVAGPSAPLYTCGIPCRNGAPNHGCPDGTVCESIPDGPRMCRKP